MISSTSSANAIHANPCEVSEVNSRNGGVKIRGVSQPRIKIATQRVIVYVMKNKLRRDDAIAAGVTAALTGAYFLLPVFVWFPICIAIVMAIAVKTGLR